MLKTSTVASHLACGAIDRAIATREPLAAIARQHGLSPWAVTRRRNALRRDYPDYLAALRRVPDRSLT